MAILIWIILGFIIIVLFLMPDETKVIKKYIYAPSPPKKDVYYPTIIAPQKQKSRKQGPLIKTCLGRTQIQHTYQSKGEKICRYVLEHLFNKPFISIRPDGLQNPRTGKNLEIDCYNDELRLGVEYDGAQHSKYIQHFHGDNPQNFVTQIENDEYKKSRCKTLGVSLIHVPHTVPLNEIPNYLIKKLEKKGFGHKFVNKVNVQAALKFANFI